MLRGAGTEVPGGPGRTSAITGRIVCRGDRTRVRPRLGGGMLFVTALFSGLMLMSIQSRRRTIAILLIGAIAILGTSPPPAQAQLPFCLPCVIQAVLATITVTIGGWLNQINGVLAKIFALFQQTVWPPGKISLAKSQIQSIITRFLGVNQGTMAINP